jgi:hypothetical protein
MFYAGSTPKLGRVGECVPTPHTPLELGTHSRPPAQDLVR